MLVQLILLRHDKACLCQPFFNGAGIPSIAEILGNLNTDGVHVLMLTVEVTQDIPALVAPHGDTAYPIGSRFRRQLHIAAAVRVGIDDRPRAAGPQIRAAVPGEF